MTILLDSGIRMVIKLCRLLILLGICFCSADLLAEQKPVLAGIQQQAEQGDALAQAKMGAIYYLGAAFQLPRSARYQTRKQFQEVAYLLKTVHKNEKQATDWMRKAVAKGQVEAEVFMAAMYDRGLGVKQDTRKATELYRKASQHGNGTAEAVLGAYANTRIIASKDIPFQYALKILTKK